MKCLTDVDSHAVLHHSVEVIQSYENIVQSDVNDSDVHF